MGSGSLSVYQEATMESLSSIFILGGTVLFVLSAVGLFKPLPKLWIATRKRAGAALLCSLGSWMVGGIMAPSDGQTAPGSTETTTEQPRQKGGLTMENYLRLQSGMSYDEVVEILGGTGTEKARSGDSTYEIVIYEWTSTFGFGLVSSTFENGSLTGKSQMGLN